MVAGMASDNLFDTRNSQDLISKSHYSSEDSNTLFLLSDSGIGTSPSVNAQQSEDEIDNLIAFTQGDTSPLLCFDSLSDTGASPKYLPDEKEERSTISTKEAPYYHSEGKLTHSKKVSKYAQKSALKKPETTSDELIAIQDSAYQGERPYSQRIIIRCLTSSYVSGVLYRARG